VICTFCKRICNKSF